VQTLTASFTQVTKSELYGADEQAGTMALQRPASMRWNFEGKQFVTDGKTMWIFNAADNQVIRYDDVSKSAASADSLLQSLDRISEIFDIEVLLDTATAKKLALKPRGEDAQQVKRIELGLTGDLLLQQVDIVDAFDTRTTLAFKDVKLDAKVPESTFQFEVPKGAEVIGTTP
jgi:outer membrane lipoprotein carrier protein